MRGRRTLSHGAVALAAAAGALLAAPRAHAITYSLEYIMDTSVCEAPSNNDPQLSQTEDQIDALDSALADLGHARNHKFGDLGVWASDVIEDSFSGGDDARWSDDSDLYAISGHGRVDDDANGRQFYTGGMCRAGLASTSSYRSTNTRFGERNGAASTAHPGRLRWVILATCDSVDTRPNQAWGGTMRSGLDAVLGYRGVSADSDTTDEVLEDYANASFGDGDRIRAAWLWAIEDWWVDDVGALVMSGATKSEAIDRRDNLRTSASRRANDSVHTWFAWAWHEG